MMANMENSAGATGLEKVSFHSNPKERQCQRLFRVPCNCTHFTSLVAQMVKCLPTMLGAWVRFLGQEDLLEKEMATHSSTLAWKNPMDRGAWWATVHGVANSRTQLSDFTSLHMLAM